MRANAIHTTIDHHAEPANPAGPGNDNVSGTRRGFCAAIAGATAFAGITASAATPARVAEPDRHLIALSERALALAAWLDQPGDDPAIFEQQCAVVPDVHRLTEMICAIPATTAAGRAAKARLLLGYLPQAADKPVGWVDDQVELDEHLTASLARDVLRAAL